MLNSHAEQLIFLNYVFQQRIQDRRSAKLLDRVHHGSVGAFKEFADLLGKFLKSSVFWGFVLKQNVLRNYKRCYYLKMAENRFKLLEFWNNSYFV